MEFDCIFFRTDFMLISYGVDFFKSYEKEKYYMVRENILHCESEKNLNVCFIIFIIAQRI